MAQDMELSSMARPIEPRLHADVRPPVETDSVPMARTLVARSNAVAFLLPEKVTQAVADGLLAWTPLIDPGAQLHNCLYQRTGYSATAVLKLLVDTMDAAIGAIDKHFEPAHNALVGAVSFAV